MKKLIVGMLAALSVSSLWAETIGWYRFEEFAQGAKPSDGTELVNSISGGPSATLKVYDTSATKYIPVAANVGTNVQTTVNDLCPVADNRSLNFQQYGKKNGSAVVVPEWEPAPESGALTPSSFTVESFFKLSGLSTTDSIRTLFSKTGAGASGQTFRVYMIKESDSGSGKLFVYLNDSQNTIDGVASTIRNGEWHHLAFAYDAESHVATVFFDYKAVLEKDVVLNEYDAARALYVGSAGVYNTAGGSTNWNCFPGYVDEVRISNKALSAEELLRFRPLDWKGDAVLDISRTPAVMPDAVFTVVSNRVAGLVGGAAVYDSDTYAAAYTNVTLLPKELDVLKPEMAYKCGSTEGWEQYMVAAYKGYVWNRSETNENWTFVCCMTSGARVYLDGTMVVECAAASNVTNKPGGGPQQTTVEVTPGAHEINLRMYLSASPTTSTTSGGGAYSSDKADWTDLWGYTWGWHRGIVIDRLGRGSKHRDAYVEIADTGDGDFLTQGNTPDVVTRTMPITVETLVATGGVSAVDLDSCDYAFNAIVGYPTFARAGKVTVVQDWTLTALPSAPLDCDGTLAFAEDATLTLDGFTTPSRMGAVGGATEFEIARAHVIEGLPTLVCGSKCWKLVKEDTVLKLRYVPSGLVVFFR